MSRDLPASWRIVRGQTPRSRRALPSTRTGRCRQRGPPRAVRGDGDAQGPVPLHDPVPQRVLTDAGAGRGTRGPGQQGRRGPAARSPSDSNRPPPSPAHPPLRPPATFPIFPALEGFATATTGSGQIKEDALITYVNGDLFASPAQVLVNTVNTVGVMGKGIAYKFKRIYPSMFATYRHYCETKQLTIGKLYLHRTPHKWILTSQPRRIGAIPPVPTTLPVAYAHSNVLFLPCVSPPSHFLPLVVATGNWTSTAKSGR